MKVQNKGRGIAAKEPQNLRRFKVSIEQFTEEHDSDWAKIHGMVGGGVQKTKGKPRKQIRKEARKLKKMRKCAFKEHKKLPTAESIAKEKEEKVKEERNRKRKEKKRLQERERKKKKKLTKVETKNYVGKEDEVRKLGLLEANKVEDKFIRQLEKQLKMNKRKKKTKSLPQCFVSDGLDFILDAVDEEKLKAMYDNEEDLNLKGWDSEDSSGTGDDNEVEEDLELSDHDSSGMDSDSGSEVPLESGDESMVIDEENSTGTSVSSKSTSRKQIKSLPDKQKNKSTKLENKTKKAVTFDTGVLKEGKAKKKVDKNIKKNMATEEKEDNGSFDVDNESDSAGEGSGSDIDMDQSDIEDLDSDEEMLLSGDENDDSDCDELNSKKMADSSNKSNLKEDIYGRLRDKAGKVVDSLPSGGYVPPAKRLQMAKTVDEKKKLQLERMKKQLQGLINRLSESNMQPISSQIEEMFRDHSRAEMSEALTAIMMNSCIAVSLIPDRLIMEQAMLMAILHHNVGSEIGAQLIQTLGQKFNELIHSGSNYGEGKELDNLLIVFSHLLNFKILHSLLIFDILKKLADNFGERDIELILLVLKSVGFTLRKEDPVMLKEVIICVQNKAGSVDISSFEDKSRVNFMLEVILAIKNNNMRKIPNYDPEHLEHMKKMIRNYVKGSSGGDTQLRISLEDLLKAEEKGRWWLVGSAWAGRDTDSQEPETKTTRELLPGVSSRVLELARKQRMNTDIRKTIFCIIMTSEDYVDAFEKLLRLGLKHQQEKEIIHVLIDVCLQEKAPNPFYAYLCQKFCELDRRFMMTTQFSMWDRFSEMEQLAEQQITNLSALLIHLIANKALSLSVFKKVEFAELDKLKVRLMKQVLTGLLKDFPDHITIEVFSRIAHLHKLQILRDGLRLFMQHFLLRNRGKSAVVNETLKEKVNLAEKALTSSAEGTSRL